MKITINDGCTSSTLNIDDKSFKDYSSKEQVSIFDIFITKLLRIYTKEELIRTLTEHFGDIEYDDESCEQCGNTGSITTLEL